MSEEQHINREKEGKRKIFSKQINFDHITVSTLTGKKNKNNIQVTVLLFLPNRVSRNDHYLKTEIHTHTHTHKD